MVGVARVVVRQGVGKGYSGHRRRSRSVARVRGSPKIMVEVEKVLGCTWLSLWREKRAVDGDGDEKGAEERLGFN